MFEVIESISKEPMRFIAAPNNDFRPGLLATTKKNDNNIIVCSVCGEGDTPIGIIATEFASGHDLSFKKEDMISIHTQRMVFRTNCFDMFKRYDTGIGLYSNPLGLFTSERIKADDIPLGRIITGPNGNYSHFEALWY